MPASFALSAHEGVRRLPNELLERIFLHLRDDVIQENCYHLRAYSWVSICLVCRWWHDVALGCPPLWSKISSTPRSGSGLKQVSLFLHRSASSPISIYLDLTSRVVFMDQLIHHHLSGQVFDRLVCATFHLGILPSFTSDDHYASLDAPFLREIRICGLQQWPIQSTVIPFSRGNLPRLSILLLPPGLSFDHAIPLCRHTVTHLDLSLQPRIALDDFRLILNRMSALEVLIVRKALPHSDDWSVVAPQFSIPRLRELTIMDSISHIEHFLPLFDVRRRSLQSIQIQCLYVADFYVLDYFSKIVQQLIPIFPESIHTLYVREIHGNQVAAMSGAAPCFQRSSTGLPAVRVTVEGSGIWQCSLTMPQLRVGFQICDSRTFSIYAGGNDILISSREPNLSDNISVWCLRELFSRFITAEYIELPLASAHDFLRSWWSDDHVSWQEFLGYFPGVLELDLSVVRARKRRYGGVMGSIAAQVGTSSTDAHEANDDHGILLRNLKTLIITGVDSAYVVAATRALKHAVQTSPLIHHPIDVAVKP